MRTRRRGFTLIELLVAISVLAVVAVLGWRGLDAIIRSRVALTDELTQTRGLQLAFAQMQSDCDKIAKKEYIGDRPFLATQPGRLTIVRMVYAENQPSRVQVVSYRITDGRLTRRESVPTRNLRDIDTAWTEAMGDLSSAPPVVLHASVNEMAIRTWVSGGWRVAGAEAPPSQVPPPPIPVPGQIPGQLQPGAATNEPTGVEVSLRLRDRPDPLVKIFLLGAA